MNYLSNAISAADSAPSTTRLIDTTGAEGAVQQYIRELSVNGAQAEATNVVVTGIRPTDAWRDDDSTGDDDSIGMKIAFVDDGYGMAPDKLNEYMGTLFSGKSAIGKDKNFRMGSRVATLPLNRYGVLIASWTEGNPSGTLLRLEYDEEQELYIKHVWELDDGRTSSVVAAPEYLKHPIITDAGHGTVVVLLGDSAECNTLGRIQRSASGVSYPDGYEPRYIWAQLTGKFLTLPNGLEKLSFVWAGGEPGKWGIPVDTYLVSGVTRKGAKDEESEVEITMRNVHGLKKILENSRKIVAKGLVPIRNADGVQMATVHWGIAATRSSAAKASVQERGSVRATREYNAVDELGEGSLFGELYQNEVYNLRLSQGGSNGSSPKPFFQLYGVGSYALQNRLILLIEPAPRGPNTPEASPSSSRSRLLLGDVAELPHAEWGDIFYKNIPSELQAIINDAESDDDTTDEETRNKLASRMARWFTRTLHRSGQGTAGGDTQAPKSKANGSGHSDGNRQKGSTSDKKRKPRARPDTHGINMTNISSQVRTDSPLVEVVWDREGMEFEHQPNMLAFSPKLETDSSVKIYINGAHKHLMDFIEDEVDARSTAVRDDVKKAIEAGIKTKLWAYGVASLSYIQSGQGGEWCENPRFRNNALSEEALSAQLLDLYMLDLVSGRATGGRAGWAKITKKK